MYRRKDRAEEPASVKEEGSKIEEDVKKPVAEEEAALRSNQKQ